MKILGLGIWREVCVPTRCLEEVGSLVQVVGQCKMTLLVLSWCS